jgi:hypothetical protein
METLDGVRLLSARGILTTKAEQVPDVPFQGRPVSAGAVHEHDLRFAVVVSGHEVWGMGNDGWSRLAAADVRINRLA